MSDRTAYARAIAGYDRDFERMLVQSITKTIATKSQVADAPIIALRTGETIGALVTVLEMIAALTPAFDAPSNLRRFTEHTSKRIRRNVARVRADPEFGAHVFGSRHGGAA